MDTNKLLQILLLVEADEDENKIQARIDEIRSLISQNTEETGMQASAKLEELFKDIANTRVSQFSQTEAEILRNLDVQDFFGKGLIEELKTISSSRSFELNNKLKLFGSERLARYNKLLQLKKAMLEIEIEPHEQVLPEIAFSIPESCSEVTEVAEYLKKFSLFLKSIQDATKKENESVSELKITRLNKGSSEFFIATTPELAKTVLDILGALATVYLAVKDIRKNGSDEKINNTLTKEELKKISEVYNEFAQKRIDDFVEDAPQIISKQLDNEKKSTIRTYVKMLLKWLPMGFHLEVIYAKKIESVSESEKSQAVLDKEKKILTLQDKISEMYKLPLEQLKLPSPTEDSTEEDKK